MTETPRRRLADFLVLLAIVAAAAGARAWYLTTCADDGKNSGPLLVQGPGLPAVAPDGGQRGQDGSAELEAVADNLAKNHQFDGPAPLAKGEEPTAYRGPGYPWVLATAQRWIEERDRATRWGQCLLGGLTAGCYFLFSLRAFRSFLVAVLAGLACALHPFWIINTAEINDGVLTTFLLALCIALGTRGSQDGGPFTSLLFGLGMAALGLVRAALLPFAVVGVVWYLFRCRKLNKGWFAALLAFLGFANGLVPWAVRNFKEFGEVVPVVDSAGWHLWMGNNPQATGGPVDESTLRQALGAARVEELTAETNQARRYKSLASDVAQEVVSDPGNTLIRRLWAGLFFVFGERWFTDHTLGQPSQGSMPAWLEEMHPGLLAGALFGILVLSVPGWRWTYAWRKQCRLATLAVIWIPLPYLLCHAGLLSGPRLPLDGVLICLAAFALGCLVPIAGRGLRRGPVIRTQEPPVSKEERWSEGLRTAPEV